MFINFKIDVEVKSIKIYSLNYKNKKIVDNIFDKLHEQNKIKYITQSTSFNFSIFVIWRDTSKKKRIVINIRDFNDIIKSNNYFFSLQNDVIITIIDYSFLFIVDVVDWFHQFLVKRRDLSKFTTINYRKQKKFNVVLMNFKNSSSYVQRQIDKMLQSYKNFIKTFVNNIITYSRIFKKHFVHLCQLFDFFRQKRVNLISNKLYLKYSFIMLLN